MFTLRFRTAFAPKYLIKQCKNIVFAKSLCSAETSAQRNASENSNKFESARELEDTDKAEKRSFRELAEHRFVLPEFLPDPTYEFRNKIREKLERADMLKRRTVINIPEFYVGSVLAVTTSDPYAPGKQNRFVGICISRQHTGLRAAFILRNVIDKQGIEILYEMYNPVILKIEVLVLEKRLDDELFYLRDAPPEYSTFPFDMEPELIVEGEPVRVNPLKIKLKPRPWTAKWWLKNLKGVEPFEDQLYEREVRIRELNYQPWENYDIMKQYRLCIPEEDQQTIWKEVDAYREQFQLRKQQWKGRILQKATPKSKERI